MKRIGIAASKMAKGNIALYNFYVLLIAFLCSLFIFTIAGATVLLVLTVISYLGSEIMDVDFQKNIYSVLSYCMVTLTIMTVVFNLLAISLNVKIPRK